MILVDERRLAFGVPSLTKDSALLALTAGDDAALVTPAPFLARMLENRTLREGERRALIRRIAATRTDLDLPEASRRSPSFAAHALAAIDRDALGLFAPLAGHYRTLIASLNALSIDDALRRALNGAPLAAPAKRIGIDPLLLAEDGAAFAWRRLAALAGFELAPIELGPLEPPALDLAAIASFVTFLRFAATQSDADARVALRSKLAPIDPDSARALLATAADRADVLDIIDAGSTGGGREFAHALRSIARAYRVPDAGAADVLVASARFLAIDAQTGGALARVLGDFDGARVVAQAWEARDAIDELAAELAGAPTIRPAFAAQPPVALEPEAPAPVTAKRATFSASSLNAFAECERKWYFRYVCAAVEDRGSSASFYGIAFHSALEDFHRRYQRFDDAEHAPLASFLDGCIVAAFDRHRTRFNAPVEFELQKRRARRTGKRYLTWLLERARRAPFEVFGCEVSTEVQLGAFPFVGYIDRLDRDDATGTVTVVDYKTGAIAKRASEYLDEVLAFREFQLPFYYWARTAAGDRVTRLALVPLKDALLDVAPVELIVTDQPRASRSNGSSRGDGTTGSIARADLERARDRMIELAGRLAVATIAAYAAAEDPDACRYCAYANACRERPPIVEERFAR